jgi:O-antigen/teichoic acid export membrane protein
MTSLAKRFSSSSFLRHNAVFFVGSLVVGVLNYAFYPIIGRLLPVSAYGEVQILISLFTQLALFLNVLNQVTVNIVATYGSKKQSITYELEKLGIYISFGVCVLAILSSKFISSFFRLSSVVPLFVMLVAFLITVPLTFRSAYLRGIKKFGFVSLISIVGSGLEILFAAVLVALGLGAIGALLGLTLSQAVAYVYASRLVRKNGGNVKPTDANYFAKPQWHMLKPELKYSIFVLILSFFTTLAPSIDVLAVKHYFNPQVAGLYAGVSVVARSVLYVTGSLAGVLLPLLSTRTSEPSESNRRTLLKSLALLTFIGGGALLVFSLFPRLIIAILMGHKYLMYAHLLPELSLAMFLFSIVNMLIVYFIALREYWTSVIIIVSTGVIEGFMLARHSTVAMIVSNLVYSSIVVLLLCSGWLLFKLRHPQESYAE